MRRRHELAIVAAAVAGTALFAAAALLWRFAYDSEPWDLSWPSWPRRPRLEGWDAFHLLSWIAPVTVAVAACLFIASRWRRPPIAAACAVLVCLQTATIYLPAAAHIAHRLDRVRGIVFEPMRELRELAAAAVITLTLAALYVAVTQNRRTRPATRYGALTVAAVLSGVLLHQAWLLMFMPVVRGWWPADMHRTDLLVPFRPCRGAMVWAVECDYVVPYGGVDDLWLHFDDPRDPRPPSPAVSLVGGSSRYYWITGGEASKLSVRIDDPAVVRCDSRARAEVVAPESWHRIGLNW